MFRNKLFLFSATVTTYVCVKKISDHILENHVLGKAEAKTKLQHLAREKVTIESDIENLSSDKTIAKNKLLLRTKYTDLLQRQEQNSAEISHAKAKLSNLQSNWDSHLIFRNATGFNLIDRKMLQHQEHKETVRSKLVR